MDIFKSIKIDKASETPLYIQLSDELLNLIEQKELPSGSKLPPIRTLANQLDVNTVTVVNAYKHLEMKKVVYSRVGSGTYLAESDLNENVSLTKTLTTKRNLGKINTENCINFADTSVSVNLFPVAGFKNYFNTVLERDKGAAFGYPESMGYEPLRITISEKLKNKGIKISPERIQIISGAQQGLDIVSKAMLNANDIVFTEKPTYYGALGAIFSRGAQAVEIPVESDGINIDVLKKLLKVYSPKFIYLMTTYQTPTGLCYSLKKKRELLELAYKYNFYIVDEDNMGDFNYGSDKNISLKALDYRSRVIYIKSFSKILMPGLRIGYMLLPKAVSTAVLSAKYSTDISTSGFIQRAFELYLKSNEHTNHIDRMRAFFSEKYKLITSLCDKLLSEYFDYTKYNGGLTIWLHIKGNCIACEELYTALLNNGVLIMPGSLFTTDDDEIKEHIRISIANVTNDEIEKGIHIMSNVCKQLYTKNKL